MKALQIFVLWNGSEMQEEKLKVDFIRDFFVAKKCMFKAYQAARGIIGDFFESTYKYIKWVIFQKTCMFCRFFFMYFVFAKHSCNKSQIRQIKLKFIYLRCFSWMAVGKYVCSRKREEWFWKYIYHVYASQTWDSKWGHIHAC